MSRAHQPVLIACLALGAASVASAATLVSDDFTSAVRVGAPPSVTGVDRNGGTTHDYIATSFSNIFMGTGSGASNVGPGVNGNSYFVTNAGAAWHGQTYFNAVTLANVGDFITLSFNFRKAGVDPATSSQSLRLGLFNSNNTRLTQNTTNSTDSSFNDDTGYQIRLTNNGDAAGTSTIQGFSRDGGTATLFAGTIVGTGASATGGADIDGDTNYSAAITLTLSAPGTVQLSGTVAGVSLAGANNVDSTLPWTTFDTAAFFFASGWGDSTTSAANFVDDVSVTTNVPEPSVAALVAGALGLVATSKRSVNRT